jgi:hypothetical protein
MNFKKLAASAIFLVSVATMGSAATITIVDYSTQGPTNDAGTGYAVGFAGNTPLGATWSDTDILITPPPGNDPGDFQSPFNSNSLTETTSYFSVQPNGGPGVGADSPVTLTFASAQSSFEILWGSIDNYNSMTFNLTGGGTHTVDGNDIISAIGGIALVDPADRNFSYEKVALVRFMNFDGTFDSIEFRSDGAAAMEFALAPIPLPAAGWMLLAGIGGLMALRRRNAIA